MDNLYLDVCICTFRRSSLHETLASIAAQTLSPLTKLRVIVADNDLHDIRRAEILESGHALGLELLYIHAPSQNISIARNACLAASTADWLIYIDDDEAALHNWVSALIKSREGNDIVFGVSSAQYFDPDIPDWVVKGDFHSNRMEGLKNKAWNGYTSNVIINRLFVERNRLRFSEAFGQTGGEDTAFFLSALDAGARFGYAQDAIVNENTPIARASFTWLARRRFRSGQTHYRLFNERERNLACRAVLKAALCFTMMMLSLARPVALRRNALRAIFHIGVVSSRLGRSHFLEYG